MNEPLNEPRMTSPGSGDASRTTTRYGGRWWGVAVIAMAVVAIMVALGLWRWRRQSSARAQASSGVGAGEMPGMSMGGGAVRLTTDQVRQFGVTFGSVERRTLQSTVRAAGTVAVDETRLTQVAPRFGGFVERLHVARTGQRVTRGQPLMDVYSPELVTAEQELLVAAMLQQSIGRSGVPGVPGSSTDLVAAAKRKLRLWDITDAQIDEIVRAGEPRRALSLYAPATGVVLEKNVVQGQAIQPGQMLYTIGNLDAVWIDIALREGDAGSARVGAQASADFAALPGQHFSGRVSYVYPTLDSIARTMRARIELVNSNGLLKPGMFATVTLTTPSRATLTVPATALVRTGERTLVFVDMGPSPQGRELMPHEIEVGRTAGDYTEVLAGLEPGQRVVTSAQFLLDSESNLAEVMKSMIGQLGAQDIGNMKDMPGMEVRGADVKDAMMETRDKAAKDKKAMPSGMKMPPKGR